MAVSDRVITLQIRSDGTGFVKDVDASRAAVVRFDKAGKATTKTAGRMGRSFDSAAVSSRALHTALLGIGSVLGARKILEYGAAWNDVENSIRGFVKIGDTAKSLQEGLFAVAQATSTNILTLSSGYRALSVATRETGESGQELIEILANVTKLAKAGGSGAEAMKAGITQLNQGLSSGVLAGDEFRSVMENIPLVAAAIAEALGKTVGELRSMSKEQKLTGDVVIGALKEMESTADALFATIETTGPQAVDRLGNSLARLVGKMDNATGATAAFVSGVTRLSDFLDSMSGGVDVAERRLRSYSEQLRGFSKEQLESALDVRTKSIKTLAAELDRLTTAEKAQIKTSDDWLQSMLNRVAANLGLVSAQEEEIHQSALIRQALRETGDEMRLIEIAFEELAAQQPRVAAGADKAAKAFDRLTDRLRDELKALQGVSEETIALGALNRAGIKLTSDQEAEYLRLVEAVDALKMSLRDARAEWDAQAEAFDDARKHAKEFAKEQKDAADAAEKAWTDAASAFSGLSDVFHKVDEDWADVVATMLEGVAQLIASFQRLNDVNMSTLGGKVQGVAGVAGAIGGGAALGGTIGGAVSPKGGGGSMVGSMLGGAVGGGLAGAQVGGWIGAIVGAVAGLVLGGLQGASGSGKKIVFDNPISGGSKDTFFNLLQHGLLGPIDLFGTEKKKEKEIRVWVNQGYEEGKFSKWTGAEGTSALGSVAILGRHLGDPAGFEESAKQMTSVIAAVDDALADMLTPEEIDEAIASIGQSGGKMEGDAVDVEGKIRERFGLVLDVMSDDLGEMFRDVGENMDIGDLAGLAVGFAELFTTFRDGAFAIEGIEGPMDAVRFVFDELRDDGQGMAEALQQMRVGFELLRRLDMASFSRDAALLADGLIDSLGGLDAATAAIGEFRLRFFSATEIMQQDIDATADALDIAFGRVGLAIEDFSGEGGMDAFRVAFDAIKDTLSAEDLALWIEAGNALGIFTDATDTLADELQRLADAEQARLDSISAIVGGSAQTTARVGMSSAERQIQGIELALERAIEQLLTLSASEEDLAAVRADAATQIAAVRATAISSIVDSAQGLLDQDGMTDFDRAIEDVRKSTEASIAELVSLGASEEQLSIVRQAGAIQIQALIDADLAQRAALREEIALSLDVAAAWARSQESLGDAMGRTGDALRNAEASFDGSVAGLEAMRDAAGEFGAAALAMLNSIAAARQSIEDTLSGSLEALLTGGMSPEEQYEYYSTRAEDLANSLDDLTDPAEIAAAIAEINRLTNLAFGVADPAQQDQIREEFIEFLEGVGEAAGGMLDDIEDRAMDDVDALADIVIPALAGSAEAMQDAAETMLDAATILAGSLPVLTAAALDGQVAINDAAILISDALPVLTAATIDGQETIRAELSPALRDSSDAVRDSAGAMRDSSENLAITTERLIELGEALNRLALRPIEVHVTTDSQLAA